MIMLWTLDTGLQNRVIMGIVISDTNNRGVRFPRLKGEQASVFPGSPLAIIGLWVFAIRERFADTLESDSEKKLPWVYNEELAVEDTETKNILIESAYNVSKTTRNYRPAIYVGRGGGVLQAEKSSINNQVGQQFETGLKSYHCMSNMTITIECESETAGESSALGELVWGYILTTRDIFRKDFGFHNIEEPVMSDTLPEMRDKEIWVTTVRFNVSFDMRWSVTPIASKLREILLDLKGDTTEILRTLASKDSI